MRMDPDPRKTLRLQSGIDLLVEEVRHRRIVQRDSHGGAALLDQSYVFDEQWIVDGRDAKAADFGWTGVAQMEQLRPGGRAISQRRRLPRPSRPAPRVRS